MRDMMDTCKLQCGDGRTDGGVGGGGGGGEAVSEWRGRLAGDCVVPHCRWGWRSGAGTEGGGFSRPPVAQRAAAFNTR